MINPVDKLYAWLQKQAEYDKDFDSDEFIALNSFLFLAYAFVLCGFAWLFWVWQLIAIGFIILGLHLATSLYIAYRKTNQSKKR